MNAHRIQKTGKTEYKNVYESMRSIFAAVVVTAAYDALGMIESGNFTAYEGLKQIVMRDGASFFVDGRYRHYAEWLDRDPDKMPADWPTMAAALEYPDTYNGRNIGEMLERRHTMSMRNQGGGNRND